MDTPLEKICTKCLAKKDLNDFGTDRSRPDGKHTHCKECRRQQSADSYTKNPEKHRAKSARYRKRHPDRIAVYEEGYKPRKTQRRRERYAENPEKELAKNAVWFEAHKDDRKLSMAVWEAKNKALRKAQHAANYLENREHRRAVSAAWEAANPGYGAIKWQRRASRQAGAEIVDLSEDQWEEIKAAHNYRCVYCPPDCIECKRKTHDLQQDHLTAVVDGGNYTVHNILPACPTHNAAKGAGPVLNPVQPLLLTVAPSHVPRKRRKSS